MLPVWNVLKKSRCFAICVALSALGFITPPLQVITSANCGSFPMALLVFIIVTDAEFRLRQSTNAPNSFTYQEKC